MPRCLERCFVVLKSASLVRFLHCADSSLLLHMYTHLTNQVHDGGCNHTPTPGLQTSCKMHCEVSECIRCEVCLFWLVGAWSVALSARQGPANVSGVVGLEFDELV